MQPLAAQKTFKQAAFVHKFYWHVGQGNCGTDKRIHTIG